MPDQSPRGMIPVSGGFFSELAVRAKLILRMMSDRRVNPFLKVLPVGTLVYFLVPDLMIGPLDDAAIIWLGTYLFVELCPPEVVQEHLDSLHKAQPEHKDEPGEIVVDGEYRDLSEDEEKDQDNI